MASETIVKLGSKTPYGKVVAVGLIGGERYYWMIGRGQGVSMMPADVIEPKPKPYRPNPMGEFIIDDD